MNKSDEAFMEDSGIVSNVDTGGLISEIGTTTPTVYGEYDDLDLLEYVEQNAFVGKFEVPLFFFIAMLEFDSYCSLKELIKILEKLGCKSMTPPLYSMQSSKINLVIEQSKYVSTLYTCRMLCLCKKNFLTLWFAQENPIPNLIKLICDEDLVVVHQAAQMILQLAKKETSNAAITNNPEVRLVLSF